MKSAPIIGHVPPDRQVEMTVTDVIRHNLRHLREERGLSQREVADVITRRTGETWTSFRVSDLEGGRKDRQRGISPEEIVTLAITYDVSVVELMMPPETVKVDDEDRPVRVRVGSDIVSPELFIRLAFLLGPQWRAFADVAHHGRRGGRLSPDSAVGWTAAKLVEAVQTLWPGVTAAEWQEMIGADPEKLVDALGWIADHYGIEVAYKIGSERAREAVLGTEKGEEE